LRITLQGNNRSETLHARRRARHHSHQRVRHVARRSRQPARNLEFYAMLEGKTAVFTVAIPANLLEALRTAQESLRETRVLDFDPSAVTGITLRAPNQPELALRRDRSRARRRALATRAAMMRPPGRRRSPPTSRPCNACSSSSRVL
jgi:hypothetical protein